jgi:hypothetical protein
MMVQTGGKRQPGTIMALCLFHTIVSTFLSSAYIIVEAQGIIGLNFYYSLLLVHIKCYSIIFSPGVRPVDC